MEQGTDMNDSQNVSNGHDRHKLISSFSSQPKRTNPDKTREEPTVNSSGNHQQLSSENSFVGNGSYDNNSDDDDFVDPLEIARIRQLSIIREGAAEDSYPTTDDEDDPDYIRLDLMQEVVVHSATPNHFIEKSNHTVHFGDTTYENVDPNNLSVQSIDPAIPQPDNTKLCGLELSNDLTCESTDQDNQTAGTQKPVTDTDGFLDLLSSALSYPPTMNENLLPDGDKSLPVDLSLPTNTHSDVCLTANDQVKHELMSKLVIAVEYF